MILVSLYTWPPPLLIRYYFGGEKVSRPSDTFLTQLGPFNPAGPEAVTDISDLGERGSVVVIQRNLVLTECRTTRTSSLARNQ